jgi:hypothetical protein
MAQEEMANTDGEHVAPAKSIVPTLSQARLHTIIAGLWICLFLAAMDTTIVTTALIKISSGFNALEQGAWLITAYLLTYNGKLQTLEQQGIRSPLDSISNDYGEVERYLGPSNPAHRLCFYILDLLYGLWRSSKHGAADRFSRFTGHRRLRLIFADLRGHHEAHRAREGRLLFRRDQLSFCDGELARSVVRRYHFRSHNMA